MVALMYQEMELHNANMFLRAKVRLVLLYLSNAHDKYHYLRFRLQVAESERAQQQMNLMPAAGSEYHQPMTSQPYDIRNFLPMNLMDTNDSYTCSDQTPLQLVYICSSLS